MEREKREWRRQVREKLALISPEGKAAAEEKIWENLKKVPEIWQAEWVYVYLATEKEVETKRLIEELWQKAVRVAAPRVEEGNLAFCQIKAWNEVERGYQGILEPKKENLRICHPRAPIIVPGLAFDEKGGRLGKGRGFYDRFLAMEKEHLTIGITSNENNNQELPIDEWDQKIKILITPRAIIDCRKSPHIPKNEI